MPKTNNKQISMKSKSRRKYDKIRRTITDEAYGENEETTTNRCEETEIKKKQQIKINSQAGVKNKIQKRTHDEAFPSNDDDNGESKKKRNAARMRQVRLKPEYKIKEKENNLKRKAKSRLDPEKLEKIRKSCRQHMKKKRKNPSFEAENISNVNESQKNAEYKREKRKDPVFKDDENQKKKRYIQVKRLDPKHREQENHKKNQYMQEKRKDPKNREKENQQKSQYMQERRKDPKNREKENQQKSQHMQEKRKDPILRGKENQKNKVQMQNVRDDETYAAPERQRNAIAKRVQRANEMVFHRSLVYNHYQSRPDDPHAKVLLDCIESRKQIPNFICSCCEGRFFERGVIKVTKDAVVRKMSKKTDVVPFEQADVDRILNKFNESQQNYMCHTCVNYVKRGSVPKLSSSNGFKLEPVPEEITRLNNVELRMLAPYVPFVKIITLSHRASNPQKGMKGNAVHVPVDVNEMFCQLLPRTNAGVVAVDFRRRKDHRGNYAQGLVRVEFVKEAAEYLQTTELYQKYEIKFQFDENLDGDETEPLDRENDDDSELGDLENADEYYRKFMEGDENCLLIDFNEMVAKLQNIITQEDSERHKTVVMAPGENKIPESVLINPDIEYLAFPEIFGGVAPKRKNKKITLADTVKWETRFHGSTLTPERILYMGKAKLLSDAVNSVRTSCRKKTITGGLTASDALHSAYGVKDHNDRWKCMQSMRCTPSYMEKKKKELFAHIAQHGAPTFFVTVSVVETNWPELIQALIETSTGNKLSLAEAMQLPYQERAKLVNDYPVIVAMYYDNKIKNIMKAIKNPDGIFPGLTLIDSFERREFQQRGSPHDHDLFWFNEAPIFDPEDPETWPAVEEFVDRYITCEYDENNPNCKFLRHKHTDTCSKGRINKNTCRFNFPRFMYPETKILAPLLKEEKTTEVKENLQKIRDFMEEYYKDKERVYKDFEIVLEELEMTFDSYKTAIRSALDRPTLIYKRRSCDIDINSYNLELLNLMESNIDVQFILDKYQTAQYVVDYVVKPDTGLSKALKDIQAELDKGNVSAREQMRTYTNKFLNGHLLSTSEAVMYCLSIPLTRFKVASIFINTAPKEERVVFLKSVKELEALDPDSTDVCGKDVITHYAERKGMDDVCLAEFAAYIFKTGNKRRVDKDQNEPYDNDDDDGLVMDINAGIKRRVNPRVIRFIRYNREQQPDNYYREKLLLFLPWRCEEKEIQSVNWFQKYTDNVILIERNHASLFLMSEEELERAVEEAKNHRKLHDEEELAEFEANKIPKDQEVDVFVEAGMDRPKNVVQFKYCSPPKVDKQEVMELLCKLNNRQKEIVMHVYKSFRCNETPLRIFISGSAGVGKSMVIKALYQLITYHLEYEVETKAHQDLESVKVLLSAFSGKAAFLIGGNTLHSAFALPLQENANMSDLPPEVANNLRIQLMHCKLMIIDEASMVGSTTLSRIDTRLRQILGVDKSFGGISVILLGDFQQLPPVKDSLIFTTPKHSMLRMDLSSLWNEFFIYELTEVMRQKNDLKFVHALNNFARGEMNDDDIRLIKTREVKEIEVPDKAMRLYYANVDVENYNNMKIAASKEAEITCNAVDKIKSRLNPKQIEKKMELYKKKPTKDCGGYPYTLHLKKDIKYMLTANLDVSDGLVNGATGTLKQVICNPGSGKPTIVFLDFGAAKIGRKMRSEQAQMMERNSINMKWTPIERRIYQMTTYHHKDHQAFRDQFPMVPCEALTIHKSQGQTYESVCLDFRKPQRMTRQLVYVALSRVTTLEGLYILGTFPGNMKSNNTLTISTNEIQRMRSERLLPLVYDNLMNVDGLVIAYLNVQSLKTSLKHILSDQWYLRCDVLVFAETCTSAGDQIVIPNFILMYRSDEVSRPAYIKKNIAKGVMCFVKHGVGGQILNKKIIFSENKGAYEGHIDLFQLIIDGVSIISGYKSPKAKYLDFKQSILDMTNTVELPSILIGDMNFNLNDNKNCQVKQFKSLMDKIGLRDKMSASESTTVLNSRLDVIFSNLDNLKTGVYECYFSDHKTIYGIISGMKKSTEVAGRCENRPDEEWNTSIDRQNTNSSIEDADVIEESVGSLDSPHINTISTSIICSNEIDELHNAEQIQRLLLPEEMGYSTIENLNKQLLKSLDEYSDEEIEVHLSNCERSLEIIETAMIPLNESVIQDLEQTDQDDVFVINLAQKHTSFCGEHFRLGSLVWHRQRVTVGNVKLTKLDPKLDDGLREPVRDDIDAADSILIQHGRGVGSCLTFRQSTNRILAIFNSGLPIKGDAIKSRVMKKIEESSVMMDKRYSTKQ
ncbi:conserved hypothetical protein [Culex quinquefasciatus]|uniref:ATP-dependent DNA helicase n=2 Tax=Culex pipiens complex TaxID=518105 RepID=B0WH72_CULQU|nr:conserved hypothetical protein [Culex quinquefasciatus]|eukprot:XP_001848037.1 conserved hypothetical protein [Culex quinquefasciatus]